MNPRTWDWLSHPARRELLLWGITWLGTTVILGLALLQWTGVAGAEGWNQAVPPGDAEKQAMAARMQQMQAEGGQNPAPKDEQFMPPAPAQADFAPLAEQGIVDGSEGLVRPWEAQVANLWQGTLDGVQFQVLAGAQVEDPAQGLVIVIETHPGRQRITQTYLAPGKTGVLRIIEVNGSLVSLSSENGGTWQFDLIGRSFQ